MRENIAAKAIDAGGKLTVKSALNPILWLCAIVSIPGLVAIQFIFPTPVWLVILVCGPVVTAMLGFLILLFVDRDKLQSEEYQIRKQTLEYMQQKGQALPSPVNDAELITPPDFGQTLEEQQQ
ncbi:hypothetical protein [Aeromonas veronii]|uniref:hypothetical protein n=1 Tax=Aeromonas veronii TaxID=654 RepID=UPI00191FEF47|nr:hypothetical protein [Aeromonas veronii]MBL0592641.1 hypothetical protein [Aeromonas veronii]